MEKVFIYGVDTFYKIIFPGEKNKLIFFLIINISQFKDRAQRQAFKTLHLSVNTVFKNFVVIKPKF